MKTEAIQRLRQIAESHSKALRLLGQTVDYTRDEVIGEALTCLSEGKEVFLMGVKNTSAISRDYVNALQQEGFLFHTLDTFAERGRAIYTGIPNPLTGRPMTGSSAATAGHVLRNINQIGIGTDGGGSVLAPALACGLYAIMGKGLGLVGRGDRVSTDGIPFAPGIGILAQEYEVCYRAIRTLIGESLPTTPQTTGQATEKSEAARMEIGIMCREDEDAGWTDSLLNLLSDYSATLFFIPRTTRREELIKIYQERTAITPILISREGPIDTEGLGDSVIGGFGRSGREIQEKGQKYFVKIANLVDATGVAVAGEELASGYLILGKKGIREGIAAIEIGAHLARQIKRPKVFEQYFFQTGPEKGFI